MKLGKRGKKLGTGAAAPTAATCPLRQTVTPTLHAEEADIWFHPKVGTNKVFKLVVGGAKAQSELGYKQPGTLDCGSTCATLYTDLQCKKPAGTTIVLPWATLLAGKTYYYKGTSEGTTAFTLTLGASPDDRVTVDPAVTETVTVKEANVVTPKIEVEYKVALLNRNLTPAAGEQALTPTPTEIHISITETRNEADRAFTKGGKLTGGTPNFDAYPDLLCTQPVINLAPPVPAADLRAIKKFYARGKLAGKFNLKLELQDGDDPDKVRLEKPVEIEFGVVELTFELHYFNDASSRPAARPRTKHKQIAMTDAAKTADGRLLHKQNNFNDHTRAKIVLKKLVAAQWPAGCDDYDIMLNTGQRTGAAAGTLALFTKERGGDDKGFPHIACKKSKLTEDREFWVEGNAASDVIRSITLDVGINRTDGAGLPNTEKRYGDWARFTIIEITEVKPSELVLPSGLVLLEDKGGSYEAYINLRADGRKIKLKAKIAPVLPNIKLYFRWFRDKDNDKRANHGVDIPGSWDRKTKLKTLNAIDKANDGDAKHISVVTTALGEAEAELQLSQFGGDKLKCGAYLDQDPIHGQWWRTDANYNKQKPVRSDDIVVWRKFWYQIVSTPGFNDHAADVQAKAATFERVKVRFVAAPVHNVNLAGAPAHSWPRGQLYENDGSATPALVLHAGNTGHFLAGIAADPTMPVKVPVLVCDAQWDVKGVSATTSYRVAKSEFPIDVSAGDLTLDPPLQGGTLLAAGTFKARHPTTNALLASGALVAGDVTIDNARTDNRQIRVGLPAACGALPDDTVVTIENISVKTADGVYLGEYSSATKRVLAVYDPAEPVDFGDTLVHELGHAFYQTPDANRNPAVTPTHQYAVNAANQGTHCRNKNVPLVGHFVCVMYDSGPMPKGLHRYCDYCHPYMLVQKMESVK